MLRRNTTVLLVLFLVLLAGTIYLQRSGGMPGTPQVTAIPTQANVFHLDTGEVMALTVEDDAGDRVVYSKAANGDWVISEPEGRQELAETIATRVAEIQGWTVANQLATPPPLESTGLRSPKYRITLTFTGGQKQELSVGDLTPTGSGYYALVNGGPPFVVNRYSVDPVLETIEVDSGPTPNPDVTPAP